jgi:hypothetical protein
MTSHNKSLQQLLSSWYSGTLSGYLWTSSSHAFVDRVTDQELKQHLLMSDNMSINDALNKALKLEVAKAAASPPARLREVTGAPVGTQSPPAKHCRNELVCW